MKAKRIAVYGRVSNGAQNHTSQLREVRAYVRRRWPKAEVTEYLDKISGAKFTREGLDALRVEVKKGRIDVLAVYRLDRLARSLQHLLQITEELRKHKTALVVPEQGIDTSEDSSAGELQLNVLAEVAQFERRIIVERINAGLAAAREHGTKSGKPFGRPRTLNRHISAVAKLRRRGLSERKIAAELKIKPGSVSAIVRTVKESDQ